MTKALALTEIRIDGGTQPRAEISVGTVREYAELLTAHVVLPPPDVFFDGVTYWLADGFHRFFAAKQVERTAITCTVHEGTKRDAVLFSVGANAGHGLQRTNADKRKAVMTLLSDDEWAKWSNVEIAKACGVNRDTVAGLRPSLADSASEPASTRTYTTKHGTEATMKTERIGRSAKPKTMPDRSPVAVEKRLGQIREMAAKGYSAAQIAEAIEIGETTCRKIIVRENIDMPAQRAVGKSRRHDSDRIVERMVMDAENLTADVNLIVFGDLDRERIGLWIDSLVIAKKSLDTFIRRLVKEQQKHGEAA